MSDIHALSGAYAVDALDDIERARFERHLAVCAECRAEVASLRETTGLLAETTRPTRPPGLRDRVLAGIATVRPLPPVTAPSYRRRDAGVDSPRRFRLVAVAAAALVARGRRRRRRGSSRGPTTRRRPPSAAEQVLRRRTPRAPRSTSRAAPRRPSPTPTRSARPSSSPRRCRRRRRAWSTSSGSTSPSSGMASAGVMPVKADQTVLLEGDAATAQAAGITVEPEGGSEHPTSEPIALFDFGESA